MPCINQVVVGAVLCPKCVSKHRTSFAMLVICLNPVRCENWQRLKTKHRPLSACCVVCFSLLSQWCGSGGDGVACVSGCAYLPLIFPETISQNKTKWDSSYIFLEIFSSYFSVSTMGCTALFSSCMASLTYIFCNVCANAVLRQTLGGDCPKFLYIHFGALNAAFHLITVYVYATGVRCVAFCTAFWPPCAFSPLHPMRQLRSHGGEEI